MNFGVATLRTPKDNDAIQGMQFSLPYQVRSNVPMVGLHGVESRPIDGAHGVVLLRGGNPSNALCVGVNDPRYYSQGLPVGTIGLRNPLGGNHVRLFSDRIEIDGGGKLLVIKNVSDVRIEGKLDVTQEVTAHCDSGPVHLTTHTHADPQGGSVSPPTPGT